MEDKTIGELNAKLITYESKISLMETHINGLHTSINEVIKEVGKIVNEQASGKLDSQVLKNKFETTN